MTSPPTNRLEVGASPPPFCLLDQRDEKVCLRDLQGQPTILYFYPKDLTPGCTLEATDFNELFDNLADNGVRIIGISPDSTQRHREFTEGHNLRFSLLSDPTHTTMEAWGAWGTKMNYGREIVGVIRSTVVLDADAKVLHALYNVKARGHAARIAAMLTHSN
ncbi:MAG: peroxiredoxin [Ferrimicrobium sp.]